MPKPPRQRAPSQRAQATRARILDAAEQLFAARGYDGTSIRDIATEAGVQAPLVSHHGGSKEALFAEIVARRADTLAQARQAALAAACATQPPQLRAVLAAFLNPFLDRVFDEGPEWAAYGRLIAHVSADPRWRPLTEQHFDPTVQHCLTALEQALPGTARDRLAAGFVFMVSAMLAVCATRWRIESLGGAEDTKALREGLVDYCAAGFAAMGAAGGATDAALPELDQKA